MLKRYAFVLVLVFAVGAAASAQNVTKETLPGVTNFARLETTIACAGATTPQAVAGLKQMGYASIINLREASEAGADIDAESVAAKNAGITFIHLPFNTASPNPEVVARFLKAVTEPKNQPAFGHCARGHRASLELLTHGSWLLRRQLQTGIRDAANHLEIQRPTSPR